MFHCHNPGRNSSTIDFDTFQFKIVQNGKLFEHIKEMSSVVEGSSENELNLARSMTRVGLYHNLLIIKVVYKDIMEYKAARVVKGLEKGLGRLRKITPSLQPPDIKLVSC